MLAADWSLLNLLSYWRLFSWCYSYDGILDMPSTWHRVQMLVCECWKDAKKGQLFFLCENHTWCPCSIKHATSNKNLLFVLRVKAVVFSEFAVVLLVCPCALMVRQVTVNVTKCQIWYGLTFRFGKLMQINSRTRIGTKILQKKMT